MIQDWWAGTAPRERILISVAGMLTAGVILVFGVLNPLLGAKADARQNLERASQDHALVERALGTLQANTTTSMGPAENFDTFRADVTQAAQQRGLSIARLQSGDDGSLQLIFSEAPPAQIYAWAWEVSALPGGQTVEANLTGRGEVVEAAVRLQGTMP